MSKFGWNYPPGAANDPRAPYNQPDRSHDHIFEDCEGPIFEDGAAMFYAVCEYAEGRYRKGWSCEEERWWRCDVERVVKLRDGKPNIAYLASEEDHHNEFRHIESVFEEVLIAVEMGKDSSIHIEQVDPANEYGDGYVRVRIQDYVVIYKQE
jgi:hypothetical protein